MFISRAFSQYSVEIKQEHWWYKIGDPNEWEGKMRAILKNNGQPIDTAGFSCQWWRTIANTETWESSPFSNTFFIAREGLVVDWKRKYWVNVFLGEQLVATSYQPPEPPYPIEAPPFGKTVTIEWKKEDGNGIGSGHGVKVRFWSYPENWHPTVYADGNAGGSGYLYLRPNSENEVVHAMPDILGSIGERFHRWSSAATLDEPYQNHSRVTVTSTLNQLAVNHRVFVADALMQVSLIDSPGANDASIEFKDPWLRDTTDLTFLDNPYGYRNKSTAATFKPGVYQIQPNLSNKYKGVFLNQTVNSGIYYSVRAPLIQTISGSSAFFLGWTYNSSYATLEQVGTNPAGYDQKAVVFNQSGATITAQYTNSTLTSNFTIPAGTYTMAGTLTVSSGATLTISSGATLRFPSGAGLVINGALSANGATFTASSSTWNGLTLNGSNGSSLQYCTINYASMPIKATNTSNVTISNVTIGNSNFYNGSDDAAMAFYNSSPTISYTTINGQGGSWNGVRFASSSTGSITNCTIQNCGAGNGIVIQGNSSPLVQSNVIRNNYYHGIITVSNGSGNPTIVSNSVTDNGVVNGVKTYVGIDFYSSAGKVGSNVVQGSNYGVYCDSYASPTTYWTGSYSGSVGNNTISSNLNGLVVYNNSNPSFGFVNYFHGELVFYGNCNNILNNQSTNAYADVNCYVWAEGNWWGSDPPTGIAYYNGSYISSYPWGTPAEPCPTGGGGGAIAAGMGNPPETISGVSVNVFSLREAFLARISGNYREAKTNYKNILESQATETDRQRALVGLLDLFRESKDESLVDEVGPFGNAGQALEITAKEILMVMYSSTGRYDQVKEIASSLLRTTKVSEVHKYALLQLASLDGFDPTQKSVSQDAIRQLGERFRGRVDQGLLVALSSTAVASPSSAASEASGDELSSYPNPFNPSTTIQYRLSNDGPVTLKVYDVLGREVISLVDEVKSAGTYTVTWDASRMPSGIYFTRLEMAGKALVKKLMLVK